MAEAQGLLTLAVIICVVALLGVVMVKADTSSSFTLRRSIGPALRSRGAAMAMIFGALSLLLLGVAHYGLVNSLPPEQHVEKSHDGNRMKVTEDANGCVDTKTLGRSNGVYMSVKSCKDPDMQQRLNEGKKPQ